MRGYVFDLYDVSQHIIALYLRCIAKTSRRDNITNEELRKRINRASDNTLEQRGLMFWSHTPCVSIPNVTIGLNSFF